MIIINVLFRVLLALLLLIAILIVLFGGLFVLLTEFIWIGDEIKDRKENKE